MRHCAYQIEVEHFLIYDLLVIKLMQQLIRVKHYRILLMNLSENVTGIKRVSGNKMLSSVCRPDVPLTPYPVWECRIVGLPTRCNPDLSIRSNIRSPVCRSDVDQSPPDILVWHAKSIGRGRGRQREREYVGECRGTGCRAGVGCDVGGARWVGNGRWGGSRTRSGARTRRGTMTRSRTRTGTRNTIKSGGVLLRPWLSQGTRLGQSRPRWNGRGWRMICIM